MTNVREWVPVKGKQDGLSVIVCDCDVDCGVLIHVARDGKNLTIESTLNSMILNFTLPVDYAIYRLQSKTLSTEDWAAAWAHFEQTMEIYQELLGQPGVMTGPALMVTFEPLLRRYNNGERSQELYDEMMAVE